MTSPLADADAAYVIDIRNLGLTQRDGVGVAVPLDIVAAPPAHTRTLVVAPAPDAQLRVKGQLEAVSEGVLVSAAAILDVAGECARCLRGVALTLTVRLQELYAYPDSATAETTDLDEVPRIEDESFSIAGLVHDELVLAMPQAPLCEPDCAGLCDECGERWEALPADHEHVFIDPRWAGLADKLGSLGQPDVNSNDEVS